MISSIIIFAFLIFGFIYFGTLNYGEDYSDSELFAAEYKGFTEDNIFVYKSANQILNILDKDGIIFFGNNKNIWSEKTATMINEVATKNNIEEIYYYDFFEDRTNNNGNYELIVEKLKNYLNIDDTGNSEMYAPTVIVVKNGKIIFYDDSTSFVRGDITPDELWNEELETIFMSSFENSLILLKENK